MKILVRGLFALVLPILLTRCETMDTAGSGGTIQVEGTSFYPDEKGKTFIVPQGAQVVGASGTNCHYIVKNGASLVAHTGNGNTYKIESGGHFRGFAHPATNCTVTYEVGAIVEKEQEGDGTQFVGL
tara:strand:+ start:1444 stop:1824 length:381 start_codon:yes stop_codon:yes gene_type:complete